MPAGPGPPLAAAASSLDSAAWSAEVARSLAVGLRSRPHSRRNLSTASSSLAVFCCSCLRLLRSFFSFFRSFFSFLRFFLSRRASESLSEEASRLVVIFCLRQFGAWIARIQSRMEELYTSLGSLNLDDDDDSETGSVSDVAGWTRAHSLRLRCHELCGARRARAAAAVLALSLIHISEPTRPY